MSEIFEYFRGIWRDRYILASLVNKDLQIKYRRSKLGITWAILTPLGLVLIIGSVYSIIYGTDPKEFIPLLFAGLNPWIFFNGTADGGTMAFIGAEGYLKQTNVNAQIFPLRITLVNFINFLYSVLAFFSIYLFLQPGNFSITMLLCVPGIILLFILSLSVANIVSIVNLNIRDYQPLQNLLMQGLFYATPIIYKTSMLDEKGFELVYKLNPFYYFIEIIRVPMQGVEAPPPQTFLIATILAVLSFVLSIKVVMKGKESITLKL